jgi:hypothetical protein
MIPLDLPQWSKVLKSGWILIHFTSDYAIRMEIESRMIFNKTSATIFAVLSLSLAHAGDLRAESPADQIVEPAPMQAKQCNQIINECFAVDGFERASCFYSASSNPVCAGTELGKVAYKRWSMAPVKDAGVDGPALLGPPLVDQACLVNFDESLKKAVGHGDADTDSVRGLSTALDSCKRDLQIDLSRP